MALDYVVHKVNRPEQFMTQIDPPDRGDAVSTNTNNDANTHVDGNSDEHSDEPSIDNDNDNDNNDHDSSYDASYDAFEAAWAQAHEQNGPDADAVFITDSDADAYSHMHTSVAEAASRYTCLTCVDEMNEFPVSPELRRSHAIRGYAIINLQCLTCGTTHDHTVYF